MNFQHAGVGVVLRAQAIVRHTAVILAQARDLTNEIMVTQKTLCDSLPVGEILHFVPDDNAWRPREVFKGSLILLLDLMQ